MEDLPSNEDLLKAPWDGAEIRKGMQSVESADLERRIRQDIRTVLGRDKSGRRLLYHLMDAAGFARTPVAVGNAHATAFFNGRQSVANYIWDLIREASPELAQKMMAENLAKMYSYGKDYNDKELKKGGRREKKPGRHDEKK